MIILKNIAIKAYSTILLLTCLFIKCSPTNDAAIDNVSFVITPEFDDNRDSVVLKLGFTSASYHTILFEWEALDLYDPKFERDHLLENVTNLHDVLDSLKYSQFIIESEKTHNYRLFSEIELFEGETMEMKSVFALEPHVDTINISPGRTEYLRTMPININRLRIDREDRSIRLHYIFKPTNSQQVAGFREMILSSNWIDLPEN